MGCENAFYLIQYINHAGKLCTRNPEPSPSLCLETYLETIVIAEISPQFCGNT